MQIIDWIQKEWQQGKTLISYGALKITGLGFYFLIPIVLAVFLPPDAFGAYSLGMMIVYFFNSITVLSSASPSIICGTEELREREKISRTTTSRAFILMISAAMFISAVLLFKNQIMAFSSLTSAQVYLLILVFVGKTVESGISCILISLNQRIREAVFQFTTSIISLTYIFLVYFFHGITIASIFPVFFISPLISACFIISKPQYEKFLPPSYNKSNFNKLMNYTRWMAMGGTAVYFLNWGDNLVLRKFSTLAEIGVYNLGYQFFKGLIMIFSIIKIYFLPFISQHIHDQSKIKHYLVVKRTRIFLTGTLFSIGLFVAMPPLVDMIYRGQYQDTILIFRILLFGAVCSLFSMFYDPVFSSLKKFHVTQAIVFVGVIMNLILDYIFISRMGFIGAAIATTMAYFAMAMMKFVYFRLRCKHLII